MTGLEATDPVGLEAAGHGDLERARAALPALAVPWVACVVTIVAVAPVVLDSRASSRRTALLVFLVGASVLFGLGLSDLARRRVSRFGRALLASGVLWCLSAVSVSTNPNLYAIGRVASWLSELTVVYLVLAYPSGRLVSRSDAALFAAAALTVLTLYLPSALVVQRFPAPSVWSLCTTTCPANPFALGHSTPAVITDFVIPLRQALTTVVFLAVALAVMRRMRLAPPPLRRTYRPVAYAAGAQAVLWSVYAVVRGFAATSVLLEPVMWLFVCTLPVVGFACLWGRLNRRLFAADALDSLGRGLKLSSTPAQVSAALASSLEDPSLHVLHSFTDDPNAWVDELGTPVSLPRMGAVDITEVAMAGWRIAVVHDPALAEDRALVQVAGSYAVAALENDRLSGELRSSLSELTESRARGLAAEERERRKIERDLHDGAQQRLVAVRVKLALTAEQLKDRDPVGAGSIRELGAEVDAAIDEVRCFARGVYPSMLARTGLRDALCAVARRGPLPVTVAADRLERYPSELELVVYFSCLEAMQNSAKHARGATHITVSVWADEALHFAVRDDGAGFEPSTTSLGAGLTNLRDRLASVDGTLDILSSHGHGTNIKGSIPLT